MQGPRSGQRLVESTIYACLSRYRHTGVCGRAVVGKYSCYVHTSGFSTSPKLVVFGALFPPLSLTVLCPFLALFVLYYLPKLVSNLEKASLSVFIH